MAPLAWTEPPHRSLLQWLVRRPLKQHLPQAIRLWVWLHLFYGDEQYQIALPSYFTYADCRTALFTQSHPSDDKSPIGHDPNCPCHKSIADWIFSPSLHSSGLQQGQTSENASPESRLQKNEDINSEDIQQWQQSLIQAELSVKETDALLNECRPFEVTRRTLASDLKRLCELNWLRKKGTKYQRVIEWPDYPAVLVPSEIAFLQQPDLALIAANLSEKIGGQQRFFVHTDYVISQADTDRVEDWQAALQQLWQQSPVLPVQLDYWSASRLDRYSVVVYPVCIYYYRRGPYLCGWGQVPGESNTINWRNYRLDRIQQLTPIEWKSEKVPSQLLRAYQQNRLPISTEIEVCMSKAWGFDYYQNAKQLLVRFDAEWDERYIRNSIRHSTFKRVSYPEARSLIQSSLTGLQQQKMLALLNNHRDPDDAYYQAIYRHDDPNVRQRLRAWRPHIEILLPYSLRSRFAYEVAKEQEFYQDIRLEDEP